MSGFLALLELAGEPVDKALLARLARRMAYRGPDGVAVEATGSVGLAHTLLRRRDTALDAPQPVWHGRSLCLAADARIDDRQRLAGELGPRADDPGAASHVDLRASAAPGPAVPAAGARTGPAVHTAPVSAHRRDEGTDAELILRSYAAWGAASVERLHGDFAFALWDCARHRLVCARDRFGVKPLYWAIFGTTFLASNSIHCLRGHPRADERLDERAMADYLIFSFNRHADRSAFAHIHRLPPAHILTLDVGAGPSARTARPRTQRYWSLPLGEPIRYRREHRYLEHFRELIDVVVADRVRDGDVGVLMSGGIDSTTVAAAARSLPGTGRRVEAFTYGYEELVDDEEADYAAVAARALGLPLHLLTLDEDRTDELWRTADAATPAPVAVPMTRRMDAFFRRGGAGIRVGLTGQGADPASHLLPEDAAAWLRRRPLEFVLQAGRYRLRYGRLPPAGLRTAVRRRLGRATSSHPVYPPWLRRDFERRLDLRARFEHLHARAPTAGALRPMAHAILSSPDLAALLETYDPGYTKFAADVRHPWLDVRLLDFMLRLPPVPWCVEKHLVRRAMQDRLPRTTLQRRKSALKDFPLFQATLTDMRGVLDLATRAPLLAQFVDMARLRTIIQKPLRLRPSEYEVVTRPLGMALWLRQFDDCHEIS